MWALKKLHEKNWRVSFCVRETSSSAKFSLNSCTHSGISEYNGSPNSIVVSFVFGFCVLLAWVSSRRPDPSSTEFDTCTGEMSLSIPSSRSRVWISLTVGEEDEEDERLWSWRSRRRTWLTKNHNRNEVLRIARYPSPVLNEMWFLSMDPLIRISVIIAKLSKRQYYWCVFEDFQSQENTNSLTYTVASSCVCTSPLAMMTIVGLLDFVKISISASLKSFLLIMCIGAPESTTKSRSSGLRIDAGRHLFSEGEKNAALWCSYHFNTFLASFQAASRAPCSCHSVSSWDRSSNFGALGLRWWGSPGQI